MANNKFRKNIAEVSVEKFSVAYINSGATHHSFCNQSVFMNYSTMNEESAKGAIRTTKIVGKGMARLPIKNGLIVEAYHAQAFSSIILAVRLLSKDFEVLLSNSSRDFPRFFLMKKRSFNIINESPLKNAFYPVQFKFMK